MNKKFWITAGIILIILTLGALIFTLTKEDENTLTINEKNWIENNKNKIIDLSIPNNVAILSSNGEGVIFDFLESLEKNTGLEINKLSYTLGEKATSEYVIETTNKKTDSDILIYQDNYALIAKNQIQYNQTSDIKNVIIGVQEDNMETINKYLLGSTDVTYKPYKNETTMITDMKNDKIDAIVLPRLEYLNDIISEEDMNIAYNITEYTQDYVLKLGDNKTLNKILKKYFEKWSNETFEENFNENLANNYFTVKNIDEKKQVEFRSKKYNYGFIQNSPFDTTTNKGLRGFNYSFLNSFAKATNIELNYKKYSSIENLENDFNNNNLDIIFDYSRNENYKMDIYKTVSTYDETIAIITDEKNDISINSINSLSKETVKVIKDSKIASYLEKHGINVKNYINLNQLISDLKQDDIAAIDYYTYDTYVRTELSNFKNIFTLKLEDDYTFICRDIKSNQTFNELFNFYLSFIDNKKTINNSYNELINYNTSNKLIQILISLFSAAILILIGVITGKIIKRKKDRNSKLTKTEKLRYIDTLTSLKNRNYLNDNLATWEESDIYPQAIIVVDLNNIAYINDNFGHTEGDKVIVEGAAVLINNQLPNSEIIRTNGNEFLVFMIGNDEKAVVTYIRKLHKEFKKISHGFGAAIGYSMIIDEIKTIDDAVNEATIDMKNNKQEIK